VVELKTYYVFAGADDAPTPVWERLILVGMALLPDPGQVGTAVRVPGLAYPGLLIGGRGHRDAGRLAKATKHLRGAVHAEGVRLSG